MASTFTKLIMIALVIVAIQADQRRASTHQLGGTRLTFRSRSHSSATREIDGSAGNDDTRVHDDFDIVPQRGGKKLEHGNESENELEADNEHDGDNEDEGENEHERKNEHETENEHEGENEHEPENKHEAENESSNEDESEESSPERNSLNILRLKPILYRGTSYGSSVTSESQSESEESDESNESTSSDEFHPNKYFGSSEILHFESDFKPHGTPSYSPRIGSNYGGHSSIVRLRPHFVYRSQGKPRRYFNTHTTIPSSYNDFTGTTHFAYAS